MTTALDAAAAQGAPLAALLAGLAAYLDHVQADPTGWRALLAARTGPLADIAAGVEGHSRALMLRRLGAENPSAALETALAGWSALERQVCLDWLERPELTRAAVEDLLATSFLSSLEAAARHDGQARLVLERLSA